MVLLAAVQVQAQTTERHDLSKEQIEQKLRERKQLQEKAQAEKLAEEQKAAAAENQKDEDTRKRMEAKKAIEEKERASTKESVFYEAMRKQATGDNTKVDNSNASVVDCGTNFTKEQCELKVALELNLGKTFTEKEFKNLITTSPENLLFWQNLDKKLTKNKPAYLMAIVNGMNSKLNNN
jgi:hypothetical protein